MSATTQPRPGTAALYDARRDIWYPKPLLRGWLHLVFFEASLVLGTLVLVTAHGTARVTAAAVYTASVSGLFGASALYHRGAWGPRWEPRIQRLDHVMIFVLIAGTATPPLVVSARGTYAVVCLVVTWALAVAACAAHLTWMRAPEILMGAVFVGLGSTAALALPAVWTRAGVAPGILMIAGGALYVAGALCYHWRRPDPHPTVFGYHEVFHAFVCAAAACHFVAIALFVV